jgi:hypothetical protein
VVAGFLHRSRETQKRRVQWWKLRCRQQERQVALSKAAELAALAEVAKLREQARESQAELERLKSQPVQLPSDPPLPKHRYGARMIALCVNLAQKVGLRGTPVVLQTLWDWLGVKAKVPHWTAVRGWLQRLGIALLEEPVERADDWIWMADHSNQIGAEKVLAILGVRASQLPPPGTPLRHADLCVLKLEPGKSWKRDDMSRAYAELAKRCGNPLAVLVDGAVELREGAEILQKSRLEMLILGDFKHRAANILKSLVGESEAFQRFNAKVGQTRCAIQQTELAHLTPPSPKPKSRFMNLAATLHWAAVVVWLLLHPAARARRGISAERFEEKLGWLREFAPEVAIWNECQQLISLSVTLINKQGLAPGTTALLRAELNAHATQPLSRELADRLLAFVQAAESQLPPGLRVPLSTEILESSFGLYKQLERQHSKGGFTTLLAAFPALLKPTTPEIVRAAFARVSNKTLQQWTTKHLGSTLAAQRKATYQEFAQAL